MKIAADISRVTRLSPYQIDAFHEAEKRWEQGDKGCTATYKTGVHKGRKCLSKPGKGTSHEGYGNCVAHGGAKRLGRATGGWLMAHAFAEELDITPWEALLYVIRITAGRVAYCQRVLAGATSDRALEGRIQEDPDAAPLGITTNPDGTMEEVVERNLAWWVDTSERERTLLAKVSKAAIDAGVAAMMVNTAVQEGEKIGAIMMATLDELEEAGLGDEMLDKARRIMERQLRILDTGQQAILGQVVDGTLGDHEG